MEETLLKPAVTIAIASSEDEARIEACMRSALAQDYPAERVEVIVADAMSMDATRELVMRLAEKEPRLRMLDNTQRTRAAALNAILRAGTGEIFVPMDPGSEYGRTHVTRCVEALAASPADQLAIVPRAAGRTLVERALSAVQRTGLAFAAGTELARGVVPVPAFLGAVRRRVFDRVGLFDPGSRAEEDDELSHRIEAAGGAVTVRRDIVVHKGEAKSFKELFASHYRLGKSRGRRSVKDRRIASLRVLGPIAIVGLGGALVATSSLQPITPFALAGYALVTGAAAVRVSRGEGMVAMPIAWAAYPVMHLAHGVGFGTGLVRAIARPDWAEFPWIGDPEPA